MKNKKIDLVTIAASAAVSLASLVFTTAKLCKYLKANKKVEETSEECTDEEIVEE